jgi:hypothetical protein
MAFENRRYVIIPTSELENVDFNEVMQTSAESTRRSLDGTLALLKYEGEQPASVAAIDGKSEEYTYETIFQIIETPAWEEEIVGEHVPNEG